MAGRFAERDGGSAFLVHRALMRSRLAAGQREAAVEPYLRCLAAVWNPSGGRAAEVPVEMRLRIDAETGLSPELSPVWFDAAAAREALPGVRQAAAKFAEPRPDALRIYFASLAAAAGDREAAERAISGIGAAETSKEAGQRAADWRDVLRLSLDYRSSSVEAPLTQLASRLGSLPPLCRPVAYHWTGLARLQSPDVETQWDGVLCLLRLPAGYGVEQPELAAAALTTAADALERLGDKSGAGALRRERATRYARVRDLRPADPPTSESAGPGAAEPTTPSAPATPAAPATSAPRASDGNDPAPPPPSSATSS